MRPRDSKDRATDAESTNDERASVATVLRSSLEGNDSRVSRVVAMVMSPAASYALGKASAPGTGEEDVVTAVDGAREALTGEQHAALARRIRLAMEHPGLDQTWPLGTPSPAPVQPSSFIAPPPNPSSVPPASMERAPISFKKTMLLGLPRLSEDAPPSSPSAPSSVPSVRASVVREVGPPRTPPPRRSRRAGSGFRLNVPGVPGLTDGVDAELEPPDHDAFQLDHRIVSPEAISRRPISRWPISQRPISRRESALGSVSPQAWLGLAPTQVVPGAGLILPPPPGPIDLEPASPTGPERPSSLLERLERSEWSGARLGGSSLRGSSYGAAHGAAPATPALTELPSTDPFAGFTAPPPSFVQRWATVMVIALAVVGVFALAALALGWLTNAAW